MKAFCFIILLLFPFITIFSQNKEGEESIPLIIDTDGGIDDLIAIMLACKLKNLNLIGITTTPSGRSSTKHIDNIDKNILNFLKYINKENIPVAKTGTHSLSQRKDYPNSIKDATSETMGIFLPESNVKAAKLPSHKYISKAVKNSEKKVSILCTGPLTNLALALILNPSIKNNIKRVYVTGGAISVSGNILDGLNGFVNLETEYDIDLDLKAAKTVLASGLPLTFIPLDVITYIQPMAGEFYKNFISSEKNLYTSFILKSIDPLRFPRSKEEANFWTSLALTYIADPSVCKKVNLHLSINQFPEAKYGNLHICRKGYTVEVCLSADFDAFSSYFFSAFEN